MWRKSICFWHVQQKSEIQIKYNLMLCCSCSTLWLWSFFYFVSTAECVCLKLVFVFLCGDSDFGDFEWKRPGPVLIHSTAVEVQSAPGSFAAVKWYQLQSSSRGRTVPVGGKGSEAKADAPSVWAWSGPLHPTFLHPQIHPHSTEGQTVWNIEK